MPIEIRLNLTCDNHCGEFNSYTDDMAWTIDTCIDQAIEEGWEIDFDNEKAICPECAKEAKKNA